MHFGHFDDNAKEYVITDPATPWPWINYLGSEDFFSLISNTAGGYSFFRDAKFRRLTRYRYNGVPMDDGGRYFYIKDGDAAPWNPGWKPCKTPLDRYECRHGRGYTRVVGEKDGLRAEVLFLFRSMLRPTATISSGSQGSENSRRMRSRSNAPMQMPFNPISVARSNMLCAEIPRSIST